MKQYTRKEKSELYLLINKLKNEGMSAVEIAEKLNDEGRVTANGCKWNQFTVYYFLDSNPKKDSVAASRVIKKEYSSGDQSALRSLILDAKIADAKKIKMLRELE